MIAVNLLFQGKSAASTHCYLKWDRASAMADFIVRQAGSLDVPVTFDVPEVEHLPDTMPRVPRSHDRYYVDGGLNWPDRYILSRPTA